LHTDKPTHKNKKKQKGQNYEQRIKHYKYKKHTYLILLCPFFGCFQIVLEKKKKSIGLFYGCYIMTGILSGVVASRRRRFKNMKN
jgi:hypothetical protein